MWTSQSKTDINNAAKIYVYTSGVKKTQIQGGGSGPIFGTIKNTDK